MKAIYNDAKMLKIVIVRMKSWQLTKCESAQFGSVVACSRNYSLNCAGLMTQN